MLFQSEGDGNSRSNYFTVHKIAGELMIQLISVTQYLYWGKFVTFLRVEPDGKGDD